jgi:hypothetical protein
MMSILVVDNLKHFRFFLLFAVLVVLRIRNTGEIQIFAFTVNAYCLFRAVYPHP